METLQRFLLTGFQIYFLIRHVYCIIKKVITVFQSGSHLSGATLPDIHKSVRRPRHRWPHTTAGLPSAFPPPSLEQPLPFSKSSPRKARINLLQTHLFNAEMRYIILKFHPVSRAGILPVSAAQHPEVILQRKSHLKHIVLEKLFQEIGQSDMVQPKQETSICRSHLQQRHLIHHSLAKRRAGFRIYSHQCMRIQVCNSLGVQSASVINDE